MALEEELTKLEPKKAEIEKYIQKCTDLKASIDDIERKISSRTNEISKKFTTKKILLGTHSGSYGNEKVWITDRGIGTKGNSSYRSNISYSKHLSTLANELKDIDPETAVLTMSNGDKALLLRDFIQFVKDSKYDDFNDYNVETRTIEIAPIKFGSLNTVELVIAASRPGSVSNTSVNEFEFYILIEKHYDKIVELYIELQDVFQKVYDKQKEVHNKIIENFGHLLIAEAL